MEFTKIEHRFFDQLVVFVVSLVGVGLVIELQHTREARPWEESDTLGLRCKASGREGQLSFAMPPLLDEFAANRWPTSLQFQVTPSAPPEPGPGTKRISSAKRVVLSLSAAFLLQYFEEMKSRVEAKYGKDTQQWPSVWNFGRVLRNAAGHAGCINFQNLSAQPVSWGNLVYSPADNGREAWLLDWEPSDVIFLINDLDAAI